jgi:hypothetical protein
MMIGKTVSELIGQDVKVKLGAQNGSAFVFCGNLKDVDICDVDEAIRNNYLITLKTAKDTIRCLKDKDLSYVSYEREMLKKIDNAKVRVQDEARLLELIEQYTPTNLGYHHWVADINKRLEYAKTTRRRVNKKLNDYTSIAERKIVDEYRSIDEANTLILLYEGTENGKAWTTHEYETEGDSL